MFLDIWSLRGKFCGALPGVVRRQLSKKSRKGIIFCSISIHLSYCFLQISFFCKKINFVSGLAFELGVDGIYFILWVLQFRTSVCDMKSGKEYLNPPTILKVLLSKKWTYFQFLSCVPWVHIHLSKYSHIYSTPMDVLHEGMTSGFLVSAMLVALMKCVRIGTFMRKSKKN